MEVSDYDWRLYRSLLPKWQERYMAKLNKEYIALLSENNNPSTNFWKLKKRIRQDAKSPGVAIDIRRSDFFVEILSLMNAGVINREDLADFSKEVTNWIDQILEWNDWELNSPLTLILLIKDFRKKGMVVKGDTLGGR